MPEQDMYSKCEEAVQKLLGEVFNDAVKILADKYEIPFWNDLLVYLDHERDITDKYFEKKELIISHLLSELEASEKSFITIFANKLNSPIEKPKLHINLLREKLAAKEAKDSK